MTTPRRSRSHRQLLVETLEERRFLAGGPVISEFMALNAHTLTDENGTYSDWIEIHNPAETAVNLDGWYLTDSAANLTKWRFPAVTLDPREYLVVFASNNDRTNPARELHTNFKLEGGGEYLALVQPDGLTVAQDFAPAYPPQSADVSYGLAQTLTDTVLLAGGAPSRAFVPTDGSLGSAWTAVNFVDAGWTAGTTGVGFDAGTGYDAVIGTDLQASMLDRNSSAYIRVPFQVGDPAAIKTMLLRMKYDDGFVAYLNGTEAVNRNSPVAPSWNSAATAEHGLSTIAHLTQDFDTAGGTAYTPGTYGALPAAAVQTGGPDGNFLRLVYDGVADNVNRVSFDRALVGSAQKVVADFDFRLSSSDPNNPAEGFSFLLLPTAVYADRGRGTVDSYPSEEPNLPIVFGVGFDVSPEAGGVNDVSVHWDGSERQNVRLTDGQIDLDAGVFHRAHVELVSEAGGMRVTVKLTPNSLGTPGSTVTVIDGLLIPGMTPYESRVEFSGRTGAQQMHVDLDNVGVEFTPVPAVLGFEDIDVSHRRDLLRAGTNVAAIAGLNIRAGDVDFLVLPELTAREAVVREGNPVSYFATPTPRALNGTTADAPAGGVEFSRLSGAFTEASFTLTLSTAAADAVIRYTLDGTLPSQTSPQYTGPLTINATRQVRARAYEPGRAAGQVNSEAYVKLAIDVQTYTSDLPIVVIENFGAGAVPADILQPSYVFIFEPGATGWTTLTASPALDTRSGVKTRGSSTAGQSYALESRYDQSDEDRGISPFGMPSESDWILYSSTFDTSLMNNSFMYELSNQVGLYASRTKHVEYFLDTGGDGVSLSDRKGVFVFMEKIKQGPDRVDVEDLEASDNTLPDISGGYMFKIDRLDPGDTGFSAASQTLAWVYPKEDIMETPGYDAQENWLKGYLNEYYAAISAANFKNPITGLHYSDYFDVATSIDFHILNEFSKNPDEFRLSTYLYKPRDEPFTYGPVWDFDRALGFEGRSANPVGWWQDFQWGTWWPKMFRDADFSQRWIDRWFELRRNEFSLANLHGIVNAQAAELAYAQRNNAAWPGYRDQLKNWTASRLTWMDSQFRPQPVFSRGNGQVVPGATVTFVSLPASGSIYYTTDGTDPRASGGGIWGTRFDGTPITITRDTKLIARVYDASATASTYCFSQVQWSAPSEVALMIEPAAAAGNVAITEIDYHPASPTPGELAALPGLTTADFEYLELLNTSGQTISFLGARFADGIQYQFDFTHAATLPAGQRLLLAANPAAFQLRYGSLPNVLGPFDDGSLSDGGETLQLVSIEGQDIFRFAYGDSGDWPGKADGKGASLELIDPAAVPLTEPARTAYLEDAGNWRSSEYGGSPGTAGSGSYVDVVVNEVLTHTDEPLADSIELYNTTGSPIDIGGWYLSDSWGWEYAPENGNYKKFRIPEGTIIPAHGYLLFDASDFNSSGGVDPHDFALSGAHGDDVWLMEADDQDNLVRFADHVEFGGAINGESFGRWPNGTGELYPMIGRTLDPPSSNSGPRVGPLIISEVMYHPSPPTPADLAAFPDLTEDDLEYIEIYNPTTAEVDLTNWRIRGGIEFDFPAGFKLAPSQARIILPFDPYKIDELGQPVNAARLAAFRKHYPQLPTRGIVLVGGFQNQLGNGGDRVQLQRPDEPPIEEPDFFPLLLEDQVLYDNTDPWPAAADGAGQSLVRYKPAEWGHSAINWYAATASPALHVPLPIILRVEQRLSTSTGFVAWFNRPLDAAALNLYDSAAGLSGPADVTLVGAATGPVAGSLVVRDNNATFVATGGPLPPDTYTLTLRSASNGFRDQAGRLLDGNNDGVAGGNYIEVFTVTAAPAVVVAPPHVMRGPGQPLDIPGAPPGLPLRVSNALGVQTVEITMAFDPALLTITGVAVSPGMPGGATALITGQQPDGRISLRFSSPTPLPLGPAEVLRILAEVPAAATYGAAHVLTVQTLLIDGAAVNLGQYGVIHTVGFLDDTTGNQSYSSLDAQRAARVSIGLDGGFTAYPKIDPAIVADVTGNGALSGLDAQRIALEAVDGDAAEIPPLPQPLRLAAPRKRDPQISEAGDDPATPPTSGAGEYLGGAPSPEVFLAERLWEPVVAEAIARIESAAGGDAAAALQDVAFEIVDLPGDLLGLARGGLVQIDIDAAGFGWFVDATPWDDVEFTATGNGYELAARPFGPAANRADLLTVVWHELGHVLGQGHADHGLMDDSLPLGVRRAPGDEFGLAAYELDQEIAGTRRPPDAGVIDRVFANEM